MSNDGDDFEFVTSDGTSDILGHALLFDGSVDHRTVAQAQLTTPQEARFVRLYPKTWYGKISMRLEIFTCDAPTLGKHFVDVLLSTPLSQRLYNLFMLSFQKKPLPQKLRAIVTVQLMEHVFRSCSGTESTVVSVAIASPSSDPFKS